MEAKLGKKQCSAIHITCDFIQSSIGGKIHRQFKTLNTWCHLLSLVGIPQYLSHNQGNTTQKLTNWSLCDSIIIIFIQKNYSTLMQINLNIKGQVNAIVLKNGILKNGICLKMCPFPHILMLIILLGPIQLPKDSHRCYLSIT